MRVAHGVGCAPWECDVWHDITTYNNNRTDLNFCAIATGDETVVSVGSGGAAVAPRDCGWGSSSHPICETGKATYVAPQVSDQTKGLNLEETYCSNSTTLITLECAGW